MDITKLFIRLLSLSVITLFLSCAQQDAAMSESDISNNQNITKGTAIDSKTKNTSNQRERDASGLSHDSTRRSFKKSDAFTPWSLVILPDTQYYTEDNSGVFEKQTRWIVENKKDENIVFVLQLGDLTDSYGAEAHEWEVASTAMSILDCNEGGDDCAVPYAIVPGNHDYNKSGRETHINKYFPVSRFESQPTWGDSMEVDRIENSYHLFNAGGQKFIVIALEFGPRESTLEWVDRVLGDYSDRKAIIITHAYLNRNSHRDSKNGSSWNTANPHRYAWLEDTSDVNDGQEMWDNSFEDHDNVFFIINGHHLGDGQGFRIDKGIHGNTVYQMLVNYQSPIPPKIEGGNGYLRLLKFLPNGTIEATSYSPVRNKYLTGGDHQFIINTETETIDPPNSDWPRISDTIPKLNPIIPIITNVVKRRR